MKILEVYRVRNQNIANNPNMFPVSPTVCVFFRLTTILFLQGSKRVESGSKSILNERERESFGEPQNRGKYFANTATEKPPTLTVTTLRMKCEFIYCFFFFGGGGGGDV